MRQTDLKFKASLGNLTRLCLKKRRWGLGCSTVVQNPRRDAEPEKVAHGHIIVLGGLRQEDLKDEASLGYPVK